MAKDCKPEVDVCSQCAATGHETKACPHKGDNIITEDELDVVLIQDPYSSVSRLTGLRLRTKVLGHRNAQEGRPWSSEAVAKRTIEPLELLQNRTSHFTSAKIDTEVGNLYIMSAYFQPSHDIEPYLTQSARNISSS
ncbi:hypothetical protein J6590_072363 [Homalodisca vitripennis]|nr:hypothetical protein J6590_072363 [Homalodisca vitripennis]